MPVTAPKYTAAQRRKIKAAFLDALREVPNVARACRLAKINTRTGYQWRSVDAEFAAAWESALAEGYHALHDEAVRRAHDGVLEPQFYQGRKCGTIRRYSDTLLARLLEAHHPAFKKRHVVQENTYPEGMPTQRHEHALDLSQMTDPKSAADLYRRLMAGEPAVSGQPPTPTAAAPSGEADPDDPDDPE